MKINPEFSYFRVGLLVPPRQKEKTISILQQFFYGSVSSSIQWQIDIVPLGWSGTLERN